MRFPVRFLGDIPELAVYRKPMKFLPADLAGRVESYMADISPEAGTRHLAALARLGDGVKICDFFAPLGERMLVIEKKKLVQWVEGRLKEFDDDERVGAFSRQCRAKAVGSAKVLGALYAEFVVARGGDERPPQAECEFWLVVTDLGHLSQMEDPRAFDLVVDGTLEVWEEPAGRLPPPYVFADIIGAEKFGGALARRAPE